MSINTINDFAFWEKKLAEEGLGDIDKKEWFSEVSTRVSRSLVCFNKHNFPEKISWIEESYNISIHFYEDSLVLIDDLWNEIGFIKKWHYSYHGLEKSSHLESVIHDQYRWKGYWRLMFELFENYWKAFSDSRFRIPKTEFSHKKSMIYFLIKYFDYKIVAKYVDGERFDVLEIDEEDVLSQNDEFDFTYELQRNRK